MMTRSREGSWLLWRRKNSRSRRFTRLRRTALPRRRVTASPRRGRRGLRRRQNDPEMARVEPPALGLGPEIVGATAEPVRFGETGCPCDGWGRDGVGAPVDGMRGQDQEALHRLDREAFPAPGPTALDDPAAAPGAHPLQKAVGSGPAQIMGLIRAF